MNDSYFDNSSRRAFSLDSRAVWVEQQLIHQVLLPRDNLPLGPGEYSPVLPSRHVSSPALGKFREPVDFVRHMASRRKKRSNSPPNRPVSPHTNGNYPENTEYKTIFHSHDIRQPFDPKLRFCETPAPLLAHSDALKSTTIEGTKEAHRVVRMEPWAFAQEERFPIKQSLPSYDVKYDSAQLKRGIYLGSFGKDKRIHIPLKGEEVGEQKDTEEFNASHLRPYASEFTNLRGSPSPSSPGGRGRPRTSSSPTLAEKRCALVRLPKLKHKSPHILTFNDSSYRNERLAKPLDLTPSLVNKKAYVRLFDQYLWLPRGHKSGGFTKSLS
ncbi:hypothetical protein EON65_49140 [archaeon]|nr:MAG: hypothetical protein EON65_49140 [archaeon]